MTTEEKLADLNALVLSYHKYCEGLQLRIRDLEAQVADLQATDSARRLNRATLDPEWY